MAKIWTTNHDVFQCILTSYIVITWSQLMHLNTVDNLNLYQNFWIINLEKGLRNLHVLIRTQRSLAQRSFKYSGLSSNVCFSGEFTLIYDSTPSLCPTPYFILFKSCLIFLYVFITTCDDGIHFLFQIFFFGITSGRRELDLLCVFSTLYPLPLPPTCLCNWKGYTGPKIEEESMSWGCFIAKAFSIIRLR